MKWSAASDLDYFDVKEAYGTACRTAGCGNDVSMPEWDTYCAECLAEMQARAGRDDARHEQLERKRA